MTALIVAFLLGDRVSWDLEVKFPYHDGFGRGEVEAELVEVYIGGQRAFSGPLVLD